MWTKKSITKGYEWRDGCAYMEKNRAFARLFYVSYEEKANRCYSITIIGLIEMND
ncbi:hypothetical protein [Bacillus pretiosus]|uniref:Uncharacterized protein n=1 Tax=Bacillus pretiosus TaxID=2983392 RepID=A0ABT3EYG2_9BACI|nr:hypothetical protein [Bacillus pretiosus]MCW1241870.1 hypothetical protein [Bacillus pretiosus]